ncbi:MAG: hypothetical protein UY26_C0003G0099 [Candidatus Jorgensenbacteria bacterium GW2011_GWA1_48_13]|uniref:Uncharacterized protein n=1 Tax=Candidatus Jorgensenbacteria bacterium GW2011_GWB1_50_10 TaxID=1618665 RepID=A0A0G1W8L4_9BACT|nr:MAG: hypothetical protein UY26_C0003G0099 [Candidatus Jorgensenbacteria bacterium GW2011_GWA1_48_13]KKW15058.1 MAG: hypothetical protein UY55_C0002G0116 [Candidatus Jorgensenbacteria bacterium GW2011_GWB1_50_10]
MGLLTKNRFDLDKKFKKVLKTPASYAFFIAIHDFVKYIELNPVLSDGLSQCIKTNQESNIATKYANLKQVYQGMEDVASSSRPGGDLGHQRYMAILDLNRIQNKEVSENNSFWKKRELFRKSIVEIQERLNLHFSRSKS